MKKTILLLTFLTGFSGLVFQVVWQKYFSFFLGGEALSSALVVSVFLAGLALGYYIFGKIAAGKSAGSLLEMAGLAEIGIGIWVFLFPTLFDLCWNNMNHLPSAQPIRGLVDFFIVVILMAPATILMGSTLPLLTSGLSLEKAEISSVHSRVYGINTLGAFLGALIAGFFLIKNLGLPMSLMILSLVNIGAGLAIKIYGAGVRQSESIQPPAELAIVPIPRITLTLAFLAGFVSIGFEIIFMRSVSLAIGSSEYSYSMVVAVFVLMIGLGAVSLKKSDEAGVKRLLKNQILLVIGLVAVYVTIPYWGWLSYLVRHSLGSTEVNFVAYHFMIVAAFSIIIALPVFFAGRCMPLLFYTLESSVALAAGNVGRLYAVNTIGSGLGGLVMGYVLLLYFNADTVFRLGIFLAAAGVILLLRRHRLVLAAVAGAIIFILPQWNQEQMAAGLYRERFFFKDALTSPNALFRAVKGNMTLLAYRDDPNTNVTVTDEPNEGRSLLVNGKSDGSTNIADLRTTLMLGHLPGLFSNIGGKAAVVGLGLGTSAEVIARYSAVEHVDVFEISQGIIDVQPLFESVNKGILQNPKVTVFQRDAFRGLLSSTEKYAVIISEPSNPWVSGVDRLFSEEFYQRVKAKMLPGGIFAQWMHAYEMSFETFGMVVRTFAGSFPHQRIFLFGSDLIILGSDAPFDQKQWERLKSRWTDMRNIGLTAASDLAFYEQFFPMEIVDDFQQNTLFYPKLSFAAAKDFFMAADFELPELTEKNPLFAFSMRRKWSHSLMSYSGGDSAFAGRVLASCAVSGKFVFENLSPVCKSRFFWLAASGALEIPKDKVELALSAEFIRELSQQRYPQTSLSLQQRLSLLDFYPWALASPSVKYLNSMRAACTGSPQMMASLIRAYLKFGYFAEAREAFGLEFAEDNKYNKKSAEVNELQRFLIQSQFFK